MKVKELVAGLLRKVSSIHFLLILAFALLIPLFQIYPGWLYFDSKVQWTWAAKLVSSGWPTLLSDDEITKHWPVLNTLIKVPFFKLTGEAGLYIYVQAFILSAALYRFLTALRSESVFARVSPKWICLLLVFSPIWINYSFFHASDVWVAICLLFIFPGLVKRGSPSEFRWSLWVCICLSLIRFDAAITSLFLSLILIFNQYQAKSLIIKVRSLTGFIVALLIVQQTFFWISRTATPSMSAEDGIALRLWELEARTQDASLRTQLVKRDASLTDLSALDQTCFEDGIWCKLFQETTSLRNSLIQPFSIYADAFLKHPLELTRINLKFASYMLGIPSPVPETEVGVIKATAPKINPHRIQMSYDEKRVLFRAAIYEQQRLCFGFFSRPLWVWLAVLLLGFFCFKTKRVIGLYSALAGIYVLPFFLFAPSRDFRYFFPILAIGYALLFCCSINLFFELMDQLRFQFSSRFMQKK